MVAVGAGAVRKGSLPADEWRKAVYGTRSVPTTCSVNGRLSSSNPLHALRRNSLYKPISASWTSKSAGNSAGGFETSRAQ